jgi:hypothetical protein
MSRQVVPGWSAGLMELPDQNKLNSKAIVLNRDGWVTGTIYSVVQILDSRSPCGALLFPHVVKNDELY